MTAAVGASAHMWAVFAIIAGAMILFAIDRIPMELSAALAVLALLVLSYFFPLPDGSQADALDIER